MSFDDFDDTDREPPVGIPHIPGHGTSRDAAESMLSTAPSLELRVAQFLYGRAGSGATDDEIEVALRLKHQTASARRRTLVLAGLVTGGEGEGATRRKTRSGRTAYVWYFLGEWPGEGAVMAAAKSAVSEQKLRRLQAVKGKGKPLDLWGMVRRAREANGFDNLTEYSALPGERTYFFKRSITTKLMQMNPDKRSMGDGLAAIVYLAMSCAHEAGIDLPAQVNVLHRRLMGRAYQKKINNNE